MSTLAAGGSWIDAVSTTWVGFGAILGPAIEGRARGKQREHVAPCVLRDRALPGGRTVGLLHHSSVASFEWHRHPAWNTCVVLGALPCSRACGMASAPSSTRGTGAPRPRSRTRRSSRHRAGTGGTRNRSVQGRYRYTRIQSKSARVGALFETIGPAQFRGRGGPIVSRMFCGSVMRAICEFQVALMMPSTVNRTMLGVHSNRVDMETGRGIEAKRDDLGKLGGRDRLPAHPYHRVELESGQRTRPGTRYRARSSCREARACRWHRPRDHSRAAGVPGTRLDIAVSERVSGTHSPRHGRAFTLSGGLPRQEKAQDAILETACSRSRTVPGSRPRYAS